MMPEKQGIINFSNLEGAFQNKPLTISIPSQQEIGLLLSP
jgi:hypothetical protein